MPVNAKLAQENYERYVYARDHGHMDAVRKMDLCEKYYGGEQWEDKIRKVLQSQGRPALTINKILATITTVQGELINSRAEITFKPAQNGTDEVAHALSRVYMHVAQSQQLQYLEQEVADDGFILSRGFFDCRVSFDNNLRGEVTLSTLNPRNVLIDPDAEGYDPDTWNEVFITKWMNPLDIALKYSQADARILRDREFSDFMYGYDSIERIPQRFGDVRIHGSSPSTQDRNLRRHIRVVDRQYWKNRLIWSFADSRTGDVRAVPENWEEDRMREVAHTHRLEIIRRQHKQIRWTTSADTVVLHDAWSPMQHFTPVPYFPFFRRGRTYGLVEGLIGSQDQLNKTSSQELHIVNTTANSGWKVRTGSLVNMTVEDLEARGGETGLVIEYNADSDKAIEKITPNQIPSGLDRISSKADTWIKELSGVGDSMRGFDRSDVAARAIEAKQQRGATNLAKPFENLRRTRYILAERILKLVQTYYTEPRVLRVTGERPTDEVEEIEINTYDPEQGSFINDLTVGDYDVIITNRPPRETYDEDQYQEALRLREIGVPIPDRTLIELSHMERKQDIIRDMGQDSTEVEREARERTAEFEAMDAEARARKSVADALLSEARARKVHAETDGEIQDPEAILAQVNKDAEMEIERMRLAAEDARERERLEFERWKFQQELDARIAYQEEQLEIQRLAASNRQTPSSNRA